LSWVVRREGHPTAIRREHRIDRIELRLYELYERERLAFPKKGQNPNFALCPDSGLTADCEGKTQFR